jgi:hypothetical protein
MSSKNHPLHSTSTSSQTASKIPVQPVRQRLKRDLDGAEICNESHDFHGWSWLLQSTAIVVEFVEHASATSQARGEEEVLENDA